MFEAGLTEPWLSPFALDTAAARADLLAVGAHMRLIDGALFSVVSPPRDPISRIVNEVIAGWVGYRNLGTDPVRFERDCGDPQTLAGIVTGHHDYPDADWFGSSITDR